MAHKPQLKFMKPKWSKAGNANVCIVIQGKLTETQICELATTIF